MKTASNNINSLIFNDKLKQQIESLLQELNQNQITWLAGYLTGISQSTNFINNTVSVPVRSSSIQSNNADNAILTVLYGSRTGNGEFIAKKLKSQAENKGLTIELYDMGDYPLAKLSSVKNLLIIVSTHGEGIPPVAAEDFYEYIHGKRVKPFDNTRFSVLSLGDKGYIHFCKTGKDMDIKLEELGAHRIYPRTDCDIDFHSTSDEWIKNVLQLFETSESNLISGSIIAPKVKSEIFNRLNPYKAKVLEKIQLNGKGSTRETFHYELSVDNSGITYEPGDAVGIFAANPERLVNEFTEALRLNPEESVEYENKPTKLGDILTRTFEISALNGDILSKYNEFAQSKKLAEILTHPKELGTFVYQNDWVDLVNLFPIKISARQVVSVLQKIQPRLYSISSSANAYPDELHLTISTVRYLNSRYKEGICSTFMSDRLVDEESVLLYPERNPDFRLPVNDHIPIIMIGAGTGVAPYRAFLQDREAQGAKGKNWLFFGERNFSTDFLYQTEFQGWHKKGFLNRLNLAFSRDTDTKVYVQHRMQEHAKELFRWIEEGAHIYVCGDAKNMGADVNQTLTHIIAKEKNISQVKAVEYMKELKKAKRYQTDVY